MHQSKRTKVPRINHGFTLIELVIVIIVLGILAATALPIISLTAQIMA